MTQDVATLVQEIHNDFDNASDFLLQEAKKFLQQEDYMEGLRKLGFEKVPEVQEYEKKKTMKRMVETTLYYKERYPFHKFIIEDMVKTICDKYDLYCGQSFNFVGSIPDKNIKEILDFKLKDEDRPESNDGVFFSWGSGSEDFSRLFLLDGKWNENKIESRGSKHVFLRICADKSQFDLSNITIIDGYKLIPDPIVLQPVKGGYLVVTKWGNEASDEIVVNEKMN